MTRPLIDFDETLDNPIAFWLMACYAYEELEHGIMDDFTFDLLHQYLQKNWDTIEHRHKYLFVPSDAGSSTDAVVARSEWPGIIFGATHNLMDDIHGEGTWGPRGQSFHAYTQRVVKEALNFNWEDLA